MEYITKPDWFLARLDFDQRQAHFLKTDMKRLKQAAFHDGRSPLAISDAKGVRTFQEIAAWHSAQRHSADRPHRIIAHMSFCGSTLLSRLLDRDDDTLVYREPQPLTDLATALARTSAPANLDDDQINLLAFLFAHYQKSWRGAAAVKPSNWANPLLPHLIQSVAPIRLVLIGLHLREYLLANLRGGRARLSYSLNLLNHLAAGQAAYQQAISAMEASNPAPMPRLLRALSLGHLIQSRLFDQLEAALPDRACLRIDKMELLGAPAETLSRASHVLQLPDPAFGHGETLSEILSHNAKTDQTQRYDLAEERAHNAQLEAQFGRELSAAEAWSQSALDV